jgi:hypothetical protein
MAQAAASRTKINTEPTQAASGQASRLPAGRGKARRPARGQARVSGDARRSARDPGRPVIELDCGITVYPTESRGGRCLPRTGGGGSGRLDKVRERLQAGASNMERPGADLIAHYLSPDRLPAQGQLSRKHAHTQRRLCERFAAPVIDTVACQDITTWHTQQIVNAAPTPGEGDRVRG